MSTFAAVFQDFFYFAGCVTAAAGLVGAASVPQLVKFKGCVCSRYGKVPPSPPPPPELRKCCVLGPPTHRPVRGAARLVGEPFLLCVIGRSTSDVLGGPRNTDRRSDGQLWDDSTCHGVDSLSIRTSCLACVSWPMASSKFCHWTGLTEIARKDNVALIITNNAERTKKGRVSEKFFINSTIVVFLLMI